MLKTKYLLPIIIALVVLVAVWYYLDAKKIFIAKFDKDLENFNPSNIVYPDTRDLAGFSQGEKLRFQGYLFEADVANNAWVFIS